MCGECVREGVQTLQIMDSIAGKWNLAMTDDQDVLAIMDAVNALPLVKLGDITQEVNVEDGVVTNDVQLAAPMPFNLAASVPWQIQQSQQPYQKFPGQNCTTHVSTPHLLDGLHTAALALGDELLGMAPIRNLLQLLQQTPSGQPESHTAATKSNRAILDDCLARRPTDSHMRYGYRSKKKYSTKMLCRKWSRMAELVCP